jgi:hypothetical protein
MKDVLEHIFLGFLMSPLLFLGLFFFSWILFVVLNWAVYLVSKPKKVKW